MIIDPSGEAIVEVVKGEMGNLAIGHQNAQYTVTRTPGELFSFSPNFSEEDPRLKASIAEVLGSCFFIPKHAKELTHIPLRHAEVKPGSAGYYEFSLLGSREEADTDPWDLFTLISTVIRHFIFTLWLEKEQ